MLGKKRPKQARAGKGDRASEGDATERYCCKLSCLIYFCRRQSCLASPSQQRILGRPQTSRRLLQRTVPPMPRRRPADCTAVVLVVLPQQSAEAADRDAVLVRASCSSHHDGRPGGGCCCCCSWRSGNARSLSCGIASRSVRERRR